MMAVVAAMIPLSFMAIRRPAPVETRALGTDNAFSEVQKKHINEAAWYMGQLYNPIRLQAEKGEDYREVLMGALREKTSVMNEVLWLSQ